jgi:hypothetical protein
MSAFSGRPQIDCIGLGTIIDHISGGNAYRAELSFASTCEYTSFKSGGQA